MDLVQSFVTGLQTIFGYLLNFGGYMVGHLGSSTLGVLLVFAWIFKVFDKAGSASAGENGRRNIQNGIIAALDDIWAVLMFSMIFSNNPVQMVVGLVLWYWESSLYLRTQFGWNAAWRGKLVDDLTAFSLLTMGVLLLTGILALSNLTGTLITFFKTAFKL